MKKLFLIPVLALTLFSTGKIMAQATVDDDPRSVPGLGIRVGINSASLYDTQGDNFTHNPRTGLAAGLFLSLPFGQYLGFQPEVMYSQKGYKGGGSALGLSYDYTRKTDYLDIPLQLQIKPSRYITLLVGPQYSFLLSKGLNFNSDLGGGSTQQDVENHNIRKNTLGLVTGLDLNFNRFILSGRVAWDLQNNNGDGTSTSPRFRNTVLQVTLGVFF